MWTMLAEGNPLLPELELLSTPMMSYTVWTPPADVGNPADIGAQMTALISWGPVAWFITFIFSMAAFSYGLNAIQRSAWRL